jgi:hypothetical protein
MATKNEERRIQTAARLSALTLANAFIAQEELADVDTRVRPLLELLLKPDPVSALAEHWQFICEAINYVPIFHLARQVLLLTPPRNEVYQALRQLGTEVRGIAAERAALRHDLMGRIYHRLLFEAKYLGTFYTSVPSATLLLKLALAEKRWRLDWTDVKAIEQLRIADLACGTGTLLMAAQQAVTDNFIRASATAGKSLTSQELRALHQAMMQEVLHGYDVLASALHLTASTLAMLAPEIAFRKMHLYAMPLGEQQGGRIALGSLDFLTDTSVSTQLDLLGEVEAVGGAVAVTGTGNVASEAPLPFLDLCVMNPPFVRSVGGNLLFGSLPADQRAKMQQKLQKMLTSKKGMPPVLASATAGLGSVFVAAAHPYIKRRGRIALVLPAALGWGVAWEKTRTLLAQYYVVETIVVSHDPKQWNFSENTELSEMLVVARKRQLGEQVQNEKTLCVNLWRNAKTPVDALGLADAILQDETADIEGDGPSAQTIASIMVGNKKWGEAVQVPWLALSGGQWHGCAFAQTELVRTAHALRQGKAYFPIQGVVKSLPIVPLSQIGELGPDRRDIYDGFSLTASPNSYPALWSHQSDTVTTLEIQPNQYLNPRTKPLAGRPLRKVDMLWPRAGRIMLAERMWLVTQRLIAVRMPAPALSNVWWPLRLKDGNEDAEKALVLWLNSTLGLVTLLSYRVPTRGPWVQFKKPLLQQVRVLDTRQLSPQQLQRLVDTYDQLANTNLLPLSEMGEDKTRALIDAAIAGALGLPPLDELRKSLGRESVVCGAPLYQE